MLRALTRPRNLKFENAMSRSVKVNRHNPDTNENNQGVSNCIPCKIRSSPQWAKSFHLISWPNDFVPHHDWLQLAKPFLLLGKWLYWTKNLLAIWTRSSTFFGNLIRQKIHVRWKASHLISQNTRGRISLFASVPVCMHYCFILLSLSLLLLDL